MDEAPTCLAVGEEADVAPLQGGDHHRPPERLEHDLLGENGTGSRLVEGAGRGFGGRKKNRRVGTSENVMPKSSKKTVAIVYCLDRKIVRSLHSIQM